MLDEQALLTDLRSIGLESWEERLLPLVRARLQDDAHGDLPKWKSVLDRLPDAAGDREQLRELLLKLVPWRKGPFEFAGLVIDAEWRSDLKWGRLIDHISPLAGRNVLDVGAGNGWYALEMKSAGAAHVIGIDPTVLYVLQFQAISALKGSQAVHVLPLRLEDLPRRTEIFDTTFSMGVLYHSRDPIAHLSQLRETLRPGGELVLETLIFPGDESLTYEPEDRYARMRNVWQLPSLPTLQQWLEYSGFENLRVIDVSKTTTSEQRTTEWMPFESLAQALDPEDPGLTIEGLPAPTRAILTANATSPA